MTSRLNVTSKEVFDKISAWSPNDGLPFEWLPDTKLGEPFLWWATLGPKIQIDRYEGTWDLMEMGYRYAQVFKLDNAD